MLEDTDDHGAHFVCLDATLEIFRQLIPRVLEKYISHIPKAFGVVSIHTKDITTATLKD